MTQDGPAPGSWLPAWAAQGSTTELALARFDALGGVGLADCLGRWRGAGLPTGHPLDGVLEASGWYGKAFVDAETVHPLLFRGRNGDVAALDPVPFLIRTVLRHPGLMRLAAGRAAFAAARPLLRTTAPRARLRELVHRGVLSAAMIYDGLPIIDVVRAVDRDTLVGLMDARDLPRPFFFVLRRDGAAGGT